MSEPSLHTRRQFLRTGVLGGAVAWTLPVFLENTFLSLDAAAADSHVQTATGSHAPILVVLQMAGGNDGLNTLIPFADDAYHRARPQLRIPGDQALKLNDEAALHPRLTGLRGLYDEGHLAIVQGVGYPNPNRSHFRSTDIWQTASDAQKVESDGWIGRYFDACCPGADPTVGVSLGTGAPLAFQSQTPTGISLSTPEQFQFLSRNASDPEGTRELFRDLSEDDEAGASIDSLAGDPGGRADTGVLDFLQRTALDACVSSDKILEITRKSKAPVPYPGGRLARDLNLVARLIAGGLPTRIYYVSQGGYDTHSGQRGGHERLLGELDGALSAFTKDLQAQGNLDRVLLMTFSEFGRRVAENSSGGTDHGTAAPLFVLGGGVKPGLYGKPPSLTRLDQGDLIHTLDFRSVYATVLEKWLQTPSRGILRGQFPTLPFV